MTPHEIPLRAAAQRLSIVLGIPVELRLAWCAPALAWTLYIDAVGGDPLLAGVPLVTGANLLEQFAHLGLGGALVAQTDHNPDAPPTFANLGSTGHLYFVTAQ